MTEFLVRIDGEEFVVSAFSKRAAWEAALAEALLMSARGELEGDDVSIEVLSMREVKKHHVPVYLPRRIQYSQVLQEVEALRAKGAKA